MTKNHKVRLQAIVLSVGVLLFFMKYVAYLMTHSDTIYSDAMESVVNIIAGALSLFSLIWASKPRDDDHPYGHGKIEMVSASVEGGLIFIAGLMIIFKGLSNLYFGHAVQRLDTGIMLAALAGLVNYAMGWKMEREGQKAKSVAMISEGQHLKIDGYSSAAMVIGLLVVYFFSLVWLDSVIAIIAGGVILLMGVRIVRKALLDLMDGADDGLLELLADAMERNRQDCWVDVHNLRTIRFGSTLHLDLHLTLPYYLSVKEAHTEVLRITQTIDSGFPSQEVELFVHVDPCVETSCSICLVQDCPMRSYPFTRRLIWTKDNIANNTKHMLG